MAYIDYFTTGRASFKAAADARQHQATFAIEAWMTSAHLLIMAFLAEARSSVSAYRASATITSLLRPGRKQKCRVR